MSETERIKKAYEKRDSSGKRDAYSLLNTASLYLAQARERDVLSALSKAGVEGLADKKILDTGCGNGGVLRDFLRYGAAPENCFGIDLLPGRIEEARRISPNMDFKCANAESLPYPDRFFDLVLSFTLFTSIFDADMKRNIASEMLRVLKKGGIILWYDFHADNIKNPDVRGVKAGEIRTLFKGCEINLRRITLAPPISRFLSPWSWTACGVLENLGVFNSHYIGVIRKA